MPGVPHRDISEFYGFGDGIAAQVERLLIRDYQGHRTTVKSSARRGGINFELMSQLSKETQEWWTHMLTIVYDDFVASESVLGPAGFVGAFHLQLIGMDPDYQGRGVAKKMISIVEDEARKQKTNCVLEAADEEHILVTIIEEYACTLAGPTALLLACPDLNAGARDCIPDHSTCQLSQAPKRNSNIGRICVMERKPQLSNTSSAFK
ncbi:hypothetical protein C8R47DRAFT_1062885 [Mycena vitilis]|nr:hypothetical protein C8R47DRAFT_1062885 [Mycena vitilis]